MGITVVKAWVCDRCGYVWIKVAGRKPLRCPGCRTRSWNNGAVAQLVEQSVCSGSVEGSNPSCASITDSILVPFDEL